MWISYHFSQFVDINPVVKLKQGEKYSFVEMKDIDGKLRYCDSVQERMLSGGSRFADGDTLFARITPCLENGKIAQVRNLKNGIGFGSTEFLVFRGKKDISDSDFIFYLSKWDEVRDFAEINLEGTSGRQRVNKDCFSGLKLSLPPLAEQKAIAAVLSSLDDKIDLLHRQNATLERMAETLFRQWFIEEAQEGWEEKTLGDVVEICGGSTPSTKEPDFWNGNIFWTSPRDLADLKSPFLFSTERKISEKGLAKISSGLLPKGTLLLSSRAPIGYLAISEIEVAINQGYIAILNNDTIPNYFMFLWCKYNMEEIKAAGNGSVFQEISKSVFRTLSFTCPPLDLVKKFCHMIEPFFQKICFNQQQIRTLEKLRDTLLPKLMSGEVRVRVAE